MAKATAAAKKVAPFFASLPEKVFAEDISSWTFYEYLEVRGKERKSVFKVDQLDDPEWEPDPFMFDDAEMARIFPDGDFEVEVRDEEGKFITRRRLTIGNPEAARAADAGDDTRPPDTDGEVQTLRPERGAVVAVKGLPPEKQAAFVTMQQEAIAARERADAERAALEADRKALRDQMLAPRSGGDSEIVALLRDQVTHLREEKMRLESTLREEKMKLESTLREDHQKENARRDAAETTLRQEHTRALSDLETRLRNEFRLEKESLDTKLKAAETRADEKHARVMSLEVELLAEKRKGDVDNLKLNQDLLVENAKRLEAEAEAKAKRGGADQGKIEMIREAINGVKEAAKIAKDLGAPSDIEKKVEALVAEKLKALNGGATS